MLTVGQDSPIQPIHEKELLSLILVNLQNPKDFYRAKLVCKLWNQCVDPLKHMKQNNQCLYAKLLQLKPYVRGSRLHFTDASSLIARKAQAILIIQKFQQSKLIDSWISPLPKIADGIDHTYSLNALEVMKKSLVESPESKDLINQSELQAMHSLKTDDVLFKKTNAFTEFNLTIKLSIDDIPNLAS